ncbi:MAG: spore maturation protein A [Oscillospiraceae bacterium]|jgi:spore maturation protein A|nr:spore maturation protein A [Oscillospiraceae bacterium]
MLDLIWSAMMIISIICAGITGKIDLLSNAVLEGAEESIKIVIATLGVMTFWSGIMRIAEDSGLTNAIVKFLTPILKFIFPDYINEKKIIHPICMNIVANLLGLGNAATPFGLCAMKEMQKYNNSRDTATNGMITLLVINTACLQLIPTFLAALRKNYNSSNPFEILPALWLSSLTALTVGIALVKILGTRKQKSKTKSNALCKNF